MKIECIQHLLLIANMILMPRFFQHMYVWQCIIDYIAAITYAIDGVSLNIFYSH